MTWAYLKPSNCGGFLSWLYVYGRLDFASRMARFCGFTFWWRRFS